MSAGAPKTAVRLSGVRYAKTLGTDGGMVTGESIFEFATARSIAVIRTSPGRKNTIKISWLRKGRNRALWRHVDWSETTEQQQEVRMPIFILWAGIPILILGGGFVVYRMIGG